MCKQIFDGPAVSLWEMMAAREARSFNQRALLKQFPHASLLSITLNIPGPVKTSERLEAVCHMIVEHLIKQLESYSIYFSQSLPLKTGPETYLLVGIEGKILKQMTVEIEETHPLGRLVDLDVLELTGQDLVVWSRSDLNLPLRRCLICQEPAKVCGRARTHSIDQMQATIVTLIEQTHL